MKFILILTLCLISFSGKTQNYIDSLTQIRKKTESYFLVTVLNKEERKHFPHLCYFPIDTTYRVQATFQKEKGKPFAMPMSSARLVYYRKVGTITFTIKDTLCKLTVYENMEFVANPENKHAKFIPFKDETRGSTTYGAGKYIDCSFKKRAKKVVIDFNTSFHPYCAYSERYSCPIVPDENTLPVSIEAGECYEKPLD